MSGESPRATDEPARPLTEAERLRRRAVVFGDVLPDATSDERVGVGGSTGRGPGEVDDETDEWLRGEVPPHHG